MEEDEEAYDAENLYTNHEQNQEMHYEEEMHYVATKAEEDNYQYQQQPNFEAYETNFQQYKEYQQQGFQFLNEELASMKIRQEQFFENMQKAQSQYLDELKQIKREQEKTIKEIEEVKKFQVNQTLMGAQRTIEEKLEERMHETRNEIIEMRKQIREWTTNASSREGYCYWAHQQANPNLVEIPPHKIPDFLHSNVANKKDPYFGAPKSDLQQGESSQAADKATQNPPNP
ncbi:hypothetical protein PIB30_090562 [Stylosanthes scabra]|uniref:Uncharacterized protein n=1 Tax=Stylosanthes scabra TaxID=79078 RepID=A0ABU6VXH5_9FABA|nr:hypothetical protein [Stylosanthes scabra]